MGIFSRVIKTIFLILGFSLIIINIILWSQSRDVTNALAYGNLTDFNSWQVSYHYNDFKGFEWFFDRISSFPAGSTFRAEFQYYMDILSSFPTSQPSNILDFLEFIANLLFAPLLLTVSIVIDVINIILWFIGFTY